jgi:hypothetical protein
MDEPRSLGAGLEIKTLRGRSGVSYLVFRAGEENFHVFREVDSEEAARDCGAKPSADGRDPWKALWEKFRG